MDHLSPTGQSGSQPHVRGGRQNQRARAGQSSILSTSYGSARASYPTQREGAQAGPSQQPLHQEMTSNQAEEAYASLFGLSAASDVFSSPSQGLGRPVEHSAAHIQDQTLFQSHPYHLNAYPHDVRDWRNGPGGSYPQPQEEGLHPPPSIAPQTGSSGIVRNVTETLVVPRQDVPTSSRAQHKTLNLTEAQQHSLDESAKRILKDYAGNNPKARDILIAYLQNVVAFLRSHGRTHLVNQGGKQKEYVVLVPTDEPGTKGGHNQWRCGMCSQQGKERTFQKVVGHFLSEHYHKTHPKPDLWVCDQPGCTRGYSGLNELNRHRNSEHGLPMPKRAREPATAPSPNPSDYSAPSASASKRARRVKPYPDANERQQAHVDAAGQDAVYPNGFPFSPASGSHAPASTRQRHGSHLPAPGGNAYHAPSHAPQHQRYGAPMPGAMHQLPMDHPTQARPPMPTPLHFSPADMNPPLSPSPSMPVPNVVYWPDATQFNQPYGQ